MYVHSLLSNNSTSDQKTNSRSRSHGELWNEHFLRLSFENSAAKNKCQFFFHIYDTKNAQETSWWRFFFLVLRGHSYVSLQPIRKPWRKFFFGLTWTYRIVHFFSRKVYRITYKKMGNIGIDIKLKYLYFKFWKKKTFKRLFVQFLSCFSFRDHHN